MNQFNFKLLKNYYIMQEDCEIFVVTLKNFEFFPAALEINDTSEVVLKIGKNTRGYSSIYQHQDRPFIFVIQQLQIQTPPLSHKAQYSFTINKPGFYTLQCLNYSKLLLPITVYQNSKNKKQSSKSEKLNEGMENIRGKDQRTRIKKQFNDIKYQEFQDMMNCLNFNVFEEIPEYLSNCFQNEIRILQETTKFSPEQDQQEKNLCIEDTNCQSIHREQEITEQQQQFKSIKKIEEIHSDKQHLQKLVGTSSTLKKTNSLSGEFQNMNKQGTQIKNRGIQVEIVTSTNIVKKQIKKSLMMPQKYLEEQFHNFLEGKDISQFSPITLRKNPRTTTFLRFFQNRFQSFQFLQ